VIAVSDFTAQQLRARWPKLHVESIPNWIEFHEKPSPTKNIPAFDDSGHLRAILVSRLVPEKGVNNLIEACSINSKISLDVYGDGPLINELKSIASIPHNSWLHIHGFSNNVHKDIRKHVLLVCPSHSESFSLAVAEAISEGLLCVVSNISAHRELLGQDYPDELFLNPGMSKICSDL